MSSSKTSKPNPVEDDRDDGFLDVPPPKKKQTTVVVSKNVNKPQEQELPTSKKTAEVKKPSKPLWLTSTPKKDDTKVNVVEDKLDDDDDFLGIRPRRRQAPQQKKTTKSDEELDGLMSRLDTSNRRNVAIRNASKKQTKQSDDEDEFLKPQKNIEAKITKPVETKPVDPTEEFLQSLKPKAKKQEDTLDFLTLDDIVAPKPVAKLQLVNAIPRRSKPLPNAEYLIP